nr:hypothetical protein Hi04_10k_c5801_00016 [uncultured bacterium]
MISRYDRILLGYAATTAGLAGIYGSSIWTLGLPTLLLAALTADGVARPSSSVFYPTMTHGPRSGDRVSLTFDDGPDPEVTPRVLDALGAVGAHATFFVIGRILESYPEIAKRIVSEGHELGNHSFGHSRLQNFYGQRRTAEEIASGREIIRRFAGPYVEPPFRPPVGLKNPSLARAALKQNLLIAAWSLHSRDTRIRDPGKICARVLNGLRAGDIVLFHDGHDLPGRHRPGCAEALPAILRGMGERGLRSVTVTELTRNG